MSVHKDTVITDHSVDEDRCSTVKESIEHTGISRSRVLQT
jgi:hypothetical protein